MPSAYPEPATVRGHQPRLGCLFSPDRHPSRSVFDGAAFGSAARPLL